MLNNTARIRVRFFGPLRNFFHEALEVDLEEGGDVGSLREILTRMRPDSRPLLEVCRAASEDSFLEEDQVLNADGDLFFLPPSSGG